MSLNPTGPEPLQPPAAPVAEAPPTAADLRSVLDTFTRAEAARASREFETKIKARRDTRIGWFVIVTLLAGIIWALLLSYAQAAETRRTLYDVCSTRNEQTLATHDFYVALAQTLKQDDVTTRLILAQADNTKPVDCRQYL